MLVGGGGGLSRLAAEIWCFSSWGAKAVPAGFETGWEILTTEIEYNDEN